MSRINEIKRFQHIYKLMSLLHLYCQLILSWPYFSLHAWLAYLQFLWNLIREYFWTISLEFEIQHLSYLLRKLWRGFCSIHIWSPNDICVKGILEYKITSWTFIHSHEVLVETIFKYRQLIVHDLIKLGFQTYFVQR